ncbi:hypothetical protein D3C86_1062040 [compost metagenome]
MRESYDQKKFKIDNALDDYEYKFFSEVEDRHTGIGLRNIRERLKHFGGGFHMASAPGRSKLNIVISMSIPCKKI